MIEKITDLDDRRLDVYARLTEVQLRNKLEPEKGIFIAESDKVIDRALDAGYEPLSFLIPEHKLEAMQGLIVRAQSVWEHFHNEEYERAEAQDMPIFVAPATEIEKLAGYELTRGVLCAMRRKPLSSVTGLLTKTHARRIAILEDITNHTNVGAAFRSAAALGVDAILVTPACCDPLYRRAVRVSMGTVFQVPWTRIGMNAGLPNQEIGTTRSQAGECDTWPVQGLDLLRSLGFTSCALALSDDSLSLGDPLLKACEKLALVFGTEGDGLSRDTIASCDYTVRIPMAHGVDSLNVAAASAVAFWELRIKE